MDTLTATTASQRLGEILADVAITRNPVQIVSETHRAVLVSATEWSSIQETLYLLSVPGLRDSIREGMQTPISECEKCLNW